MALKQFYQTNFANGEFMKHKTAYALAILLGAAIVQFNGCETLKSSYDNVESKVIEIMDNYKQPEPQFRQYTFGG
jgi:hypothetical protein